MQRKNLPSNLTDQELLSIVTNEKLHQAEASPVNLFIKSRNIKLGKKFYTTRFLYYLYLMDGFEEVYINSFARHLKQFVPQKRFKNNRGFMLYDLKETTIEIYRSYKYYEKKQKKTTKRFVTKV
jgi:hypothetical protein